MNRGLLAGWVTRTQHRMSQVEETGVQGGQEPPKGHKQLSGPISSRKEEEVTLGHNLVFPARDSEASAL